MKKLFAYHALMRLLSILALLALLIVRFALAGSSRIGSDIYLDLLFESLVLSNVVLGMYPDGLQDIGFSLAYSTGTVVLSCIAGVFGKSSLVALVLLAVYLSISVLGPKSKFNLCFRNDSIWAIFESHAAFYYLCMFLIIAFLFKLVSSPRSKLFLLVLLFLLYVLRYFSAYTGWTFIASKSRECNVKKAISGFLRGVPAIDIPDEQKLLIVYERAREFMESEKPYLDPDYDMGDLSSSVFANKTYLSRAINYYSGKNFRQFLNYYRVMHSIELMKENDAISVVELSYRCGFHSTVSYNLAFKLVMNNTPSNYRNEFIIGKRPSK